MDFFSSLGVYYNFPETVVASVCSEEYMFFVTKNNTLFRFDISEITENISKREPFSVKKITPKHIQRIAIANYRNEDFLLCLSENQIFFQKVNNFRLPMIRANTKEKITDFDVSPNGAFITAITADKCDFLEFSSETELNIVHRVKLSKNPTSVVSTNKYSALRYKSTLFYINNTTKEVNYDDFGKISTFSAFLLQNKNEYELFNKETTDYEVAVFNGNKVVFPSASFWSKTEIKVSQGATKFYYNYPYTISIVQQSIIIQNVVTDEIQEIKHPQKLKNVEIFAFPDKSFIIASEKNFYLYKHNGFTQQINELLLQNSLQKALILSVSTAQEKTEKIQGMFLKYCDALIIDDDYEKAFSVFKMSEMPPQKIISHFTTLIPTEIESDKIMQSEWISKRNMIPEDKQRNRQAIKSLLSFIRTVFKEWEIKGQAEIILNTIIVECLLLVNQNEIANFIDKKPPLFFETTKRFLVENGDTNDMFLLCRKYGRNKDAIEFMEKEERVDELIEFCQQSEDVFAIGQEAFDYISGERPEAAYLLFTSKNIQPGEAFEIANYIECSTLESHQRVKSVIKFLEYCIYEAGIEESEVHRKLITTYTSMILSITDKEGRSKYIAIKDEKEPLKSYRESLKRVITFSDFYHPISMCSRIPPILIEERLLINMKAGNIETCVEILTKNISEEIIIEFCDFSLERLPNIYTELIKKLGRNPNSPLFKSIVNKRGAEGDIETVMNLIPDSTPISQYRDFIEAVTIKRYEETRILKITNALKKTNNNQKFILKGPPLCRKCGKQINGEFALDDIGNPFHVDCL